MSFPEFSSRPKQKKEEEERIIRVIKIKWRQGNTRLQERSRRLNKDSGAGRGERGGGCFPAGRSSFHPPPPPYRKISLLLKNNCSKKKEQRFFYSFHYTRIIKKKGGKRRSFDPRDIFFYHRDFFDGNFIHSLFSRLFVLLAEGKKMNNNNRKVA